MKDIVLTPSPLKHFTTVEEYQQFYLQCSQLSEDEYRQVFRFLARTDLFFLLYFVLNKRFISNPWLIERCKEIESEPNGYLDLWARGHCKAVDLNEPVPTPTGFVKHGDLKVGDYIYSPAGKQIKIVAKTKVVTNAECFRVTFDCGYSVVVSGQHLWTIEKSSRKRIKGVNSREGKTLITLDTFNLKQEVDKSNQFKTRIYPRVLTSKAIINNEQELTIDPYVLGLWLGDGSAGTANITCGYQDLEEILVILSKTKHKIKCSKYKTVARITIDCGIKGKKGTNHFKTELNKLGIFYQKKIPDIYLNASIEQRRALLQGLLDSDGTCHKKHSQISFVNINKELAEDVLKLASSLGYKTSFYKRNGWFKKKPYDSYIVQFKGRKEQDCFRLKRKQQFTSDNNIQQTAYFRIKKVEQVESIPVSCIQVDSEDGLYLIGYNYIATHNSTILTYGKTIQDILASHGENRLEEWNIITGGSEPAFAIFSATTELAQDHLRRISREFEANEFLRALFPDICWQNTSKEASNWKLSSITLKQKTSNYPTLEAHGFSVKLPVGKRYNVMIFDDIIRESNVTTPEQIAASMSVWEGAQHYAMAGLPLIRRHIGTFYHWNDLYCQLIEKDVLKVRKHAATDNAQIDGRLVYLTQREWDNKVKELSRYSIGCQYLLNPTIDNVAGFKFEWLKYAHFNFEERDTSNFYILVDPASSKKKTSDYTVMIVIACGADQNYYVVDMVRDRLSLQERADKLFKLHSKYRPQYVAYEQYGMQADIEHIMYLMNKLNYHFKIIEVKGIVDKKIRINRLEPDFRNGRILLPLQLQYIDIEGKYRDLIKEFVKEEYLQYPASSHDDMLDCLSRIKDINIDWPLYNEDSYYRQYEYKAGNKITGY